MNTRRPRWLLLGLLLAGWLAREAPGWYRYWKARPKATPASRRKPKTAWPWVAPPAPRVSRRKMTPETKRRPVGQGRGKRITDHAARTPR